MNRLDVFRKAVTIARSMMQCNAYLYEIGAIDSYDTYENFYVKDDIIEDMEYPFRYMYDEYCNEMMLTNGKNTLIIGIDIISYVHHADVDYDEYADFSDITEIDIIFEISDPRSITTEESVFQTSTITNISSIHNPIDWIKTVIDDYSIIAEIMESD